MLLYPHNFLTWGGVFNKPIIYDKLQVIATFMPLGLVGNDIFILISGYFMTEKEDININKIAIKLLSQLAFSTLFLVIVPNFIINNQTNYHYYLLTSDIFNSASWFVGYYFVLILFAYLFFNKYLNKLDKKQYTTLLTVLFGIVSFFYTRSIIGGLAIYLDRFVLGCFLYSLGGYIKKYNPFNNIHTWVLLVLIVLVFVFVWIDQYNLMNNRIEDYLRSGSIGEFTHTIVTYDNHSILVISLSLIMFELFRRIPVFHSRIINYLSSATLMAYLIHDNTFFKQRWNKKDWLTLLMDSPLKYLLQLVKWTFGVFFLGVAVYSLYLLFIEIFNRYKYVFINNKDKT